jgi:hypothetical protein
LNPSVAEGSEQSSLDASGRVRIWNTFFKLAWAEAKLLFETTRGRESQDEFDPDGGTLDDDEFHSLATLVLCTLAIEARANHLLDELVEQGKLEDAVADAAKRLPAEHKWFLLPTLGGTGKTISATEGPHQAIKQICALRNDLIHVDYGGLKRKLPTPDTVFSYFERFVAAMEGMNVVLQRGGRDEPRDEVLRIGKFECKS